MTGRKNKFTQRKSRPAQICECGGHAWAPLTKGFVTIVEPQDAHFLDLPFSAAVRNRSVYAVRSGKMLHRLILGSLRGDDGEHENANGLDNRRSNLRPASRTQNNGNQRPQNTGREKSRFKGVRLLSSGWWMASIQFEKNQKYLGLRRSEVEAAKLYDAAASQIFGEFARLNFTEKAACLAHGIRIDEVLT